MMQQTFSLRPATLATNYRNGNTTPRALLTTIRQRAETLDPEFNLFIHLLSEVEQTPFLVALEGHPPETFPLYDVPFATKDNIDLAEIVAIAAYPTFAYRPTQSATTVAQLIALGVMPAGKTNPDQSAVGLNGTRSPYGHYCNAYHPTYLSGGSSAGSALAAALGTADFALGTDIADNGRVPAGPNSLVGLKATRRVISTAGVAPVCRTPDRVTFFSATVGETNQLLALVARTDSQDSYSRHDPQQSNRQVFGRPPAGFRSSVPQTPNFLGCRASETLFAQVVQRLTVLDDVPAAIDLAPLLAAARLLYDGPWVAERYVVAGPPIGQQSNAVLPVIRDVLAKTPGVDATVIFKTMHQLQGYKAQCDTILDTLDCVLTPTFPYPVTLDELVAEPAIHNADPGYYTSFMNLLNYATVSVPCRFMPDRLLSDATLFGRAFTNQYLLSLADAFQRMERLPLVSGTQLEGPSPAHSASHDQTALAVCDMHLTNLPLNGQLLARGGRLLQATHNAPRYRLYVLADGERPAMACDKCNGMATAMGVWEIPNAEAGLLLAAVPALLGLGQAKLADGRWVTSFIREAAGLEDVTEITARDDWRQWLIR